MHRKWRWKLACMESTVLVSWLFKCDSAVKSHLHSKTFSEGCMWRWRLWSYSRPAVLQMSWAVCYQVYVTWDYPRWHPLKANSQQCSWGGIWWRACMRVCVRVYVCVHAFRLAVTFGRTRLSPYIVVLSDISLHYFNNEHFEGMWTP